MDERLRQAYLFDFYGEMLNEHQRQIYEDYILNDLSLSEIAGEEGISRQAVQDMVKRCSKKLEDYEAKLHLVEKFLHIKADVERIHDLVEEHQGEDDGVLGLIEKISQDVLSNL